MFFCLWWPRSTLYDSTICSAAHRQYMHNVTFKIGMKGFKTFREQIRMLEASAQAGSARCREKRRKRQEEEMKPRRGGNRTERGDWQRATFPTNKNSLQHAAVHRDLKVTQPRRNARLDSRLSRNHSISPSSTGDCLASLELGKSFFKSLAACSNKERFI